MRKLIAAMSLALLLAGCGEEVVHNSKIEGRNGLAYLPNEETPFTGRAYDFFLNGQTAAAWNYKDGKLIGRQVGYHPDGTVRWEVNYKDGIQLAPSPDNSKEAQRLQDLKNNCYKAR